MATQLDHHVGNNVPDLYSLYTKESILEEGLQKAKCYILQADFLNRHKMY